MPNEPKEHWQITVDVDLARAVEQKIAKFKYGTRSEFAREAFRRLIAILDSMEGKK